MGSLLTPAGVPANTSTALQSLAGCLPAFRTLSPFSSQRTTSSIGPVAPSPQPLCGRVEDYQGLILTLYPVWPSGLVVAAGSQVCHAGLREIPKAILGFGVATLSLQPSEMELATGGVCWRTCYLAFHPRQGESCLEPWAPGRMSSGSLGPAAALIVGSCRACFLS